MTRLLLHPFSLAALLAAPLAAQTPRAERIDLAAIDGLAWREAGPYRGGRSAAVCGIPQQRDVYYMGATGGGVWKTTDGGHTWRNVSDPTFGGSIGAVAVSEWDPNVVYAGEGEITVRGNVSHGEGVWRSTDAGRSWKRIGLTDSRHIGRIRIHPRDPDTAWVAALGHLFGPNEQRGVFRTRDGGASWEKVLYVDAETGACDLCLDPTNPRILYATTWRVLRTPYSLESGGPGSGIWKSTDGGDTWTELTRNDGLPDGTIGICGITVSPADPDNLYAIVEAAEGGVFRSRDAGATWRRVNDDRSLRQRAWYYTRIYADPADADAVWVVNVGFHRSTDGGRTFDRVSTPHGDNHDLWIDPGDPLRMIEANDGGVNVTVDGGATWTAQDNQPTAQFYRVSTDNDFPYRLLGGQQDNSAVRLRSRSLSGGGIGDRDWEPTAGGESGHIVAKPDEPDVVFGGSYGGYLIRVDHRTDERRAVHVWPDNPMGHGAADLRYRFQWNFPIVFSPHDPNRLYAAANVLFVSDDEGASWRPISPDLTRDDKDKQGPSGGPITKDNTSVEYYCTIFAVLESPHEPGVLWCGSDDGLVHVSRDGGEHWANVTPPAMPEWAQVNSIEAHPFAKGGLYVAATRYKSDDFRPYLYRTTDYGATWTEITTGIDPLHFTRVIRADPDREGLLYAGTERGIYVSFDDGGLWQPLRLGLPVTPVTDLAVKGKDLIAATQGRGFWILDDLTPLHELTAAVAAADVHLFQPRPAYRIGAGRSRNPRNMGTNPPSGVVLRYRLREEPAAGAKVELEIATADGEVIRTFTRRQGRGDGDGDGGDRGGRRGGGESTALLEAKAGLNEFAWDLRYPGAERFDGMILWSGGTAGPRALPGRYTAKLTVGDVVRRVEFEVRADPRSSATAADLRAQFDFLIGVRDKLGETHRAIADIRTVRRQVDGLKPRAKEAAGGESILAAIATLRDDTTEIEEALYQTRNRSRQDPLNFPIRLNDKLAGLLSVAAVGDHAPTAQMHAVRAELTAQIDAQLERLETIWATALPALNGLVREAGIDPVVR